MLPKTVLSFLSLTLTLLMGLANAAALLPRGGGGGGTGNGDPGYCNILQLLSLPVLPNFCLNSKGETLSACACLSVYSKKCTDELLTDLLCNAVVGSACATCGCTGCVPKGG